VSDTLSLAGLDMPVVIPIGVPDLWVSATGHSRAGGDPGGAYWESVEVAPAPGDQDPPWRLATFARRGCRPGGNGGWTLDSGLHGAATAAVGTLLLAHVPNGLPRDELHRLTEASREDADKVIAALGDPEVWQPGTIDVDGHRFMLWVHHRDEGFAAVADLGPVVLSAHGRTPPSQWRAALLDPAAAQGQLR
jgi:hypothetical protein